MNNEQILFVDDDDIFTQVLSRAFTRRGYHVLTAANSDDALQIAQCNNIEKAVIDLKLDDESGLLLLQRLLAIEPQLNIIVLTGYSSIATAVEAIKLGATNYLCKPADTDEIIQAFSTTEANPHIAVTAQPPSINRLQWEHIQKVLAENSGNISATARTLGMHRRTLQRKLQKRPVPK